MKKKVLSLILTITLALSVSAFPIYADEVDKSVPDAQESSDDTPVGSPSLSLSEASPVDVDDGTYMIVSAVGNFALNIDGEYGSALPGANANIMDADGRISEIFTIQRSSYSGRVCYTIASYSSGMTLDVAGAQDANQINVQQYTPNGTYAQKFEFLQSRSDGYITIKPVYTNNRVLDVYGGVAANATNVQIWDSNNTAAQMWKLIKTDSPETDPVTAGVYTISNKASNLVIDIAGGSLLNSTNVQTWAGNGTAAQKFYIQPLGHDNCYYIFNVCSLRALDAACGGITSGTNIQIYDQNKTAAQIWQIYMSTDGSYSIRNAKSGLCVDVSGGSHVQGANIQLWSDNGTNAQKWVFNPQDDYIPNGATVTISSAQSRDQVFDVAGASQDNGTVTQMYKSNGTNCQKWKIKSTGDGYYYLENENSGKVLDVSKGIIEEGARVQQWDINRVVPQQKWQIIPKGSFDGSYFIEAYNTGLRLDITGGQAQNNAALTLSSADDNSSSQIFYMQGVTINQSFVSNYYFAGNTSQIIDVNTNGTTGTLTLHNKNNGHWNQVMSTICHVGRNGISSNRHEGDGTTPAGLYTLGQAFGIQDNPGSTRSYHKLTQYDYWIADSSSPYYNQMIDSRYVSTSLAGAEHLVGIGARYNYAIAINFNTDQVPGKGSAIFLHCTNGDSTSGCVSIPENLMVSILRQLRSDTLIYIH